MHLAYALAMAYRTLRVSALVIAIALSSCGGSSNTPRGNPGDIVRSATDRTIAAGVANIVVSAGDGLLEAKVDLESGRGTGRVRSVDVGGAEGRQVTIDYAAAYIAGAPSIVGEAEAASISPLLLTAPGAQPGNPLVALDLLRGAVNVVSYGGVSVRGTATFRYELDIDPKRAISRAPPDRRESLQATSSRLAKRIPADVWIDSNGRVRRLQLGVDLRAHTTSTDQKGVPLVTVIDFVGFEEHP